MVGWDRGSGADRAIATFAYVPTGYNPQERVNKASPPHRIWTPSVFAGTQDHGPCEA